LSYIHNKTINRIVYMNKIEKELPMEIFNTSIDPVNTLKVIQI